MNVTVGISVRPIGVWGPLAANDFREPASPVTQKTVRIQDAQENPHCFPQLLGKLNTESFAMLGIAKGYSKG